MAGTLVKKCFDLKYLFVLYERDYDMEKRKDIDMLRFYEGDIRIRTSENRLLFKDFSKNSGNPQDKLWGDKEAYRTLNALLFDGYNNERERIQKEMHLLNPVFIELLDETLDIYKGVFSTMCGKKEIVASVSKVRRVDRRASLSAYEKGTTESFVSCSKGPYGTDFSKKNQVILLEIEIPENSPYVDYQQVLAEEYEKWDEQEVLFPPFLPVTIKEIDLSRREKLSIHDMHGNPPIGKYLLKMGEFPDYRKVISFSQKELLEKLLAGKAAATICLQKMNVGQWDEDFQEYVKWKEYLHAYLKLVYSDMWYGEKE